MCVCVCARVRVHVCVCRRVGEKKDGSGVKVVEELGLKEGMSGERAGIWGHMRNVMKPHGSGNLVTYMKAILLKLSNN